MFVDEVDIHVQAGGGGNGCMAFRREKFVPRGGPSGGNGGGGGSVYLVASPHQNTLVSYRFHPEFKAERGGHGEGSNCTGRDGADLTLDVPPGTVVYEATGDEFVMLADLAEPESRVLVARGGRGGRGNAAFATSTNRAPRRTEPGQPGEERSLRLRLKLLADVGLVGYPNAGKSTLISRISAARPKIADYPFTTLVPNLGVVGYGEGKSFVVADIPGLIEGAHEGNGLGDKFLRHVTRTSLLIHLLDASNIDEEDPLAQWRTVNRELELFDSDLGKKPQIVVANKIDLPAGKNSAKLLAKKLSKGYQPLHAISAVTTAGVHRLVQYVGMRLEEIKQQDEGADEAAGL
jgi:GTPase